MKFKTHEELDDYYRKLGVDVDKLKREEKEVGINMIKAERDAKNYLKKRMGIIRYYFWNITNFELIPRLDSYEEQNFIIKAKELGWKDTFQYPKGFD